MRIAVFGGTGSLGWIIVRQATSAEYGCKVLTRKADKMPEVPGVQFVQGDARDGGKVMLTLAGCDAAIIALRGSGKDRLGLLPSATSLILAGMHKLEIERVVLVSALGVGDSLGKLPLAGRLTGATIKRKELRERAEQERLVRESGLAWTIIRPSKCVDGDASGSYRIAPTEEAIAKPIILDDAAECIVRETAAGEYTKQVIALIGT
jgi:putative NADH-flavin reductase